MDKRKEQQLKEGNKEKVGRILRGEDSVTLWSELPPYSCDDTYDRLCEYVISCRM